MVVITGVLSTLAVVGFGRHMRAARGAEATGVMLAIRSGEESYMAENHLYLSVSTGTNWYPQLVPSNKRYSFVSSTHPDYARWRRLAPPVNGMVMFGYLVTAGVPGTKPAISGMTNAPVFAAQPLDWYVIQALGTSNGKSSRYAFSSMTGEMYVEGE